MTEALPRRPEPETPPLAVRPARAMFIARPGVAELVTHPLLDDVQPPRSPSDDLERGLYLSVPAGVVPIYRITAGGRTQVGLILEAAVAEYVSGRIRPHEATRPHAVGALADHLEASAVDIAPVTLTYRPDADIERLVTEVADTPPAMETISQDGAEHRIWLPDADRVAPVLRHLRALAALYVVDGHHRCAAAALLAVRAARHESSDAAEHLFAFLVAQDQLTVASYHLLVGEVSAAPAEVVAAVAGRLGAVAQPADASLAARTSPGVIAMWCGDGWYRFDTGTSDPLGDAATIHRELLGPVLGIGSPGRDPRILHVAGTVAPHELQARLPEGTVAFVVHPPPVAALFEAADAGWSVPAKSSFFHPKMPAGLFVRSRR
jgi:uncharacterized protein (DUF1015 family)